MASRGCGIWTLVWTRSRLGMDGDAGVGVGVGVGAGADMFSGRERWP